MSDIKKLFKQSSYYFIGHVLIMLAGFISLPILTRILSVSEYGAFGLVTATVFILVAISKFGAQYSAVRYYNEYKKKGEKELVKYYTTFFIQSLLFICTILSIFLIINRLFPMVLKSQLKNLLYFIVILCITRSLIIRLKNFIRVEQRTKLFSFIGIIHQYGGLGMGLFFVFYFSKTLPSFLSGQILVDILIMTVLVFILFYKKRVNLKKFSIPLLKKSLSYGFPLLLLELSSLFFKFIDRYLIQFKLGSEALGLYTVGANLSQYIQDVIFLPISLAIFPLYMEIWTNKEKEAVVKFLSKTTNYLLILCIPIVFGFSVLSKEIVIILASDKFAASAKIIPFIITGAMIWGFYHIFAAGLYIYKKTKILAFVIFLTCCLNIILNLLLIPILGILGSAISILISYIVMTFVVIKISFKYVKIEINLFDIGGYIIASIIMSLIIYNIKIDNTLYSLLLKTLVGFIIYLTVVILIDEKIRNIANRFLGQFFLKYGQTD